ncbi:MAG: ATP-binding protein, partial [Bacteroidia bacterium]|nr:ATP-binding protein [Bacteroidia bacterium]
SFLRPRRFGKSLWLSVLEYYYDIRQAEKFEKLFGKYYIGKNPTSLRNSFRILKFDFSGIDTRNVESAEQGFYQKVKLNLLGFIYTYQCFSTEQKNIIFSFNDAEEVTAHFFRYYPQDVPIYILFDEYDHFTNEILYQSVEKFKEAVSKQGYYRKFFEVVKTATQQGVVDRVFITGVSSVTLDGLTSGFNILTHLTYQEEFEAMTGFTEEEVRELFRQITTDKQKEEEVIEEMRTWYNGYRFSRKSKQTIYNSDMALYYLRHFQSSGSAPDQMLDMNIAPDYGKLRQLFQVIEIDKHQETIQQIIEHKTIVAPLIGMFSFDREFGTTELVNFLAYLGNLTIDKPRGNYIQFKIPNKVIEILYWKYYAEILEKRAAISNQTFALVNASLEMGEQGNFEPFFQLVQNLLKGLSNRDFIQFSEKQIKLAIIAYLMLADNYDVISERELQSGGYPDILLFSKPQNPVIYEYAIEVKYLKKEEENQLAQKQEEAKNQLLSYYQNDANLQKRENLILVTVVAVKDVLHTQRVW